MPCCTLLLYVSLFIGILIFISNLEIEHYFLPQLSVMMKIGRQILFYIFHKSREHSPFCPDPLSLHPSIKTAYNTHNTIKNTSQHNTTQHITPHTTQHNTTQHIVNKFISCKDAEDIYYNTQHSITNTTQ